MEDRRTADHLTTLTAHGARHVVGRHRLLETFLVQVVGLRPDEVHTEADALEHAVSDPLLDRIDELLGRPARDPHGDPIPRDGDAHVEEWGMRLDGAAVGGGSRVERVQDWDGPALRHLLDLGVRPDVELVVVERAPCGGPLRVRSDGRDHALGAPLTRLVHGREVRADVLA